MSGLDRDKADALASEMSRDGVKVSYSLTMYDEALAISVTYPDGLRTGVRFDPNYDVPLEQMFSQAKDYCDNWHANQIARS